MDSVVVSFISLFASAFIVLAICLIRTIKKKQAVASKVRLLIVVNIISVGIQTALLFAKDVQTALMLHTFY